MADDDRAVMERLAALEAEVKADADAQRARKAAALAKLPHGGSLGPRSRGAPPPRSIHCPRSPQRTHTAAAAEIVDHASDLLVVQ